MSSFLLGAIASIKVADQLPGSNITLSEAQAPVVTDLGNGLYVVYLVDDGENLTYVQHHHLQSANVKESALHEIGLMNLARKAKENLRTIEHGEIHGLLLDGMFEASLLLLDELWNGPLAKYAPNGAVIAIPTRDVLAFCDSQSAQGLTELKQLVGRSLPTEDHVLTSTLFRREGGDWHPTSLNTH